MYSKDARERNVQKTADTVAGLVNLVRRRQTVALDIEQAAKRHQFRAGSLERYVPPLACFRTVGKRSLSTPTTFKSRRFRSEWGGSFGTYESLLWDALRASTGGTARGLLYGSGFTLPFSDADEPDAVRFLDTNGNDRGRVSNMVLIGMRAKVTANVLFDAEGGVPSSGDEFNASRVAELLEKMIRQYVAIGLYHTADSEFTNDTLRADSFAPAAPSTYRRISSPWVDQTPLEYFDRPDGAFVSVPPLLFSGRDTHAKLTVIKAQFGTGTNQLFQGQRVARVGAPNTTLSTIDYNVWLEASVLIEALFVPPPSQCGNAWPGELCPVHKIGGHPSYRPDLPAFVPLEADDVPHTVECSNCHNERPTPSEPKKNARWSIFDPRHNLNEGAKQMLLLEQHLFEADKWCPDCVHKHALMIEALGGEGMTLCKAGQGGARQWCKDASDYGREIWAELEAARIKQPDGSYSYPAAVRHKVGAKLRKFRKELTRALRSWED